MKPLLVGEMPSRTGDRYHNFPLSGAVAQTLCQMAGIQPQDEGSRYGRWTWALYEVFDTVNAIKRHGPWDSDVAAERLKHVIESDREVVVLLGRRPQSAYARMYFPAETMFDSLKYFSWRLDMLSDTGRRQVAVIPHPSSLNRTYNEAEPRERAGQILREAIEKANELAETQL